MRSPFPYRDPVPPSAQPSGPRHYYGDVVRVLFVIGALLIFATEFFGSNFLTPFTAILAAAVLIILAGLVNPVQTWIHMLNGAIAGLGAITCGYASLLNYKATQNLVSEIPLFGLALIFLAALYFSVKTVRGVLMRNAPIIT